MARTLTFKIKRKEYQASPLRIDRKKLYGWTEILALDDNGEPCKLVSADDTGALIIPKGGTGLGILTPDGRWVNRSELITVQEDGSPAEPVTSSFNRVIQLKEKISMEEFLEYSITAFYELDHSYPEFIKAVGKDIYTFSYSYLDSYQETPAFILAAGETGEDNIVYMLTGYRNNFEMLNLEQPGLFDETGDEPDEDTGELDFSMF